MNEFLSNPAYLGLIGVLIGSVMTFVGNILREFLAARKDTLQWKNQRIALKEDRDETRRNEERTYATNVYHQCIHRLSHLVSFYSKNKDDNSQQILDLIQEANEWVALFCIRNFDNQTQELVDCFIRSPRSYCDDLRCHIIELIKRDECILSGSPREISKGKGVSRVSFRIDKEFQRETLIDGVILPTSECIAYNWEQLKRSHRECLVKVFFNPERKIPVEANLFVPSFNPRVGKVEYQRKNWEAKINPLNCSVLQIFDSWVADFQELESIAITEHNRNNNKPGEGAR
jgi:hypothetical protein